MTITTASGWEGIGRHHELCGHHVFTVDAPSIGPEVHEPLLILHGKSDPRVHPSQSLELYRHLKVRGKAPVRLVLYG